MVKMGSISTLVSKFELKKTESNGPSVKIRNFPTDFDVIPSKMVKIGSISTLVSKFESKETESNGPSVKIRNFPTHFVRT